MTHPVHALFDAIATVAPYPKTVELVPELMSGTAFFPGGGGLWTASSTGKLPDLPNAGVMVVGQDFHSKAGYLDSHRRGGEVRHFADGATESHVPTWRSLIELLGNFGIPPERCFFTNAYMGLRRSGKTGPFPGIRDKAFVARCGAFFRMQIEALNPRLILGLGRSIPNFLGAVTKDLAAWRSVSSLSQLDCDNAVISGVRFVGGRDPCTVVCITHPSLYASNVSRRKFHAFAGRAAEREMVAQAIRDSGVDLRVRKQIAPTPLTLA